MATAASRVTDMGMRAPSRTIQSRITTVLIFMPVFLFRYTFILFSGPFGYGSYIGYYTLLPFFASRYRFPWKMALLFIPILLTGWINVTQGNGSQDTFLKVALAFFTIALFYWYAWQYFKQDVRRVTRIYIRGAYLVSAIGLVLWADLTFLSGSVTEFLRNFVSISVTREGSSVRLNSTLGEPNFFANAIAPAALLSLNRLLFSGDAWGLSRRKHVIILLAFVLCLSGMALAGLAIAMVLLLINRGFFRHLILGAVPLFFLLRFVLLSTPEFNDRFKGMTSLISGEKMEIGVTHGSSIVLYMHARIAWMNFSERPFFGTGLGSHEVATQRYVSDVIGEEWNPYRDQNAKDANSMFLRLMSETGMYGAGVMLWLLFFHYVPRHRSSTDYHWLISSAFAVAILLNLIRQGNYILNGFPFFLWGYYIVWSDNRRLLKERRETIAQENIVRKKLERTL
jgi:hypothetical protein